MAYAEGTTVEFEKSIAEIITLIKRHGAQQIGQMENDDSFLIGFKLAERVIRFKLPLPTVYRGPRHHGNGREVDVKKALDQQRRQKGRALLLVIKAKLESVESGIETVEQAFFANVVMANGQTVYERAAESIALEYETGKPIAVAGLLAGPQD